MLATWRKTVVFSIYGVNISHSKVKVDSIIFANKHCILGIYSFNSTYGIFILLIGEVLFVFLKQLEHYSPTGFFLGTGPRTLRSTWLSVLYRKVRAFCVAEPVASASCSGGIIWGRLTNIQSISACKYFFREAVSVF